MHHLDPLSAFMGDWWMLYQLHIVFFIAFPWQPLPREDVQVKFPPWAPPRVSPFAAPPIPGLARALAGSWSRTFQTKWRLFRERWENLQESMWCSGVLLSTVNRFLFFLPIEIFPSHQFKDSICRWVSVTDVWRLFYPMNWDVRKVAMIPTRKNKKMWDLDWSKSHSFGPFP